MDKLTYLAELAEGLARWVPERERQDILRYYAEYFEEAGPDKEAQVVQELGDPWALSCRLAVEGGYVTWEQAESWTPPKKKKWPWVLVGAAAVLLAFISVPIALLSSLVGGIVGRSVAYFDTGPVTVVEQDPEYVQWGIAVEDGPTTVEGAEMIGGFWNMEDGCLDAFSEIDADISLGNITVTGGSDYTLCIDQSTTLGGYSLKWEVKNGVLKIRDGGAADHVQVNNWDDLKSLFGVGSGAVGVIITVPEGELVEVSVKTDLGDIFLGDLRAAVKIEAETSMGNVEGYELRARAAGKISLETSMGDVTLGAGELWSGVEIELETSMGNVEAQLDCVEEEVDYEAKTSMGSVTVNDEDRGTKARHKGGDYKLAAKSDMGDVHVYFQEDRW